MRVAVAAAILRRRTTKPGKETHHGHGRRRRRIPDQSQEHQQVPGLGLPRVVQLRPRARPAGEGRLGAARRGLPHHLRAARRPGEAGRRDREGAERRRASLPGDRPGPRGRGDLLAPARRAQGPRRDQRRRRQAGGVPRDHQARRARGNAPPARPARWPDRCVSGAPGARLPGRLHAVAGALAQAARLALGRTRAVGGAAPDLRARERDRGVQAAGILEHPGGVHHAKRRRLPGAPEHARRQQAGQVRPRERGRRQARGRGDRGAAVPPRERREEAGAAPPGAAVRDQHLAAGGLAQARLRRRSDHAHRPAPVRRRQSGRRDGRPDHLHAHRQRAALGRGARGLSPSDRRSLRRPLSAGEAAVLPHQDQERPGGARGDPADRPRAHPPGRGALSRRRSTSPVRADLEADHGQPDGQRRARPRGRGHRGPPTGRSGSARPAPRWLSTAS